MKSANRIAAAACLVAFLALGVWADPAKDAYKAAQAAELKQDFDTAYTLYRKALTLHPDDIQYQSATQRTQFEAALNHVQKGEALKNQQKIPEALAEMQKALSIDPSLFVAQQEIDSLSATLHPPPREGTAVTPAAEDELQARLDRLAGPPDLGAVAATPIDLVLHADAKQAYQTVAGLAHIGVIFDNGYPGNKPVNLNLVHVSLLEALHIINIQAASFYTVVTPSTIMVADDTTEKRQNLEPEVEKTFYVNNLVTDGAQLTDVVNTIRQIIQTQGGAQVKIQALQSLNAIVVRDTLDKVEMVQKLLDDLDKAPSEVMVDVRVLQVSRDLIHTYGLEPPTSTTLGLNTNCSNNNSCGSTNSTNSLTGTTTSTTSSNPVSTLNELAHLNGSNFTVTISPATLNALLSDSTTRTLQAPQIRAVNGIKATMNIGQRIPIASGSFQPGIGGVGINPLVNTQFQYTPVGVNIEMTPYIHGGESVTLKNHIEISDVDSYNNIGGISEPVIGQKVIDQTIDLAVGQSSVLGGMLEDNIIHTKAGLPVLSNIPILDMLFSNIDNEVDHTEVLIVMTPHLVRSLGITPMNRAVIDTGPDRSFELNELPPATTATPTEPTPAPAPSGGPPPAAATGVPRAMQPGALPPAPVPVPPAPPTAAAAAGSGEVLMLDPPQQVVSAGQTVTVRIQLDNARDAYSLAFQLNYDGNLFELQTVEDGGLLSRDRQPVAIVHREDAAAGIASVTLSRPPNTPGITGSGTLVTVSFVAKGKGVSPITISRLAARNPQGAVQSLQTQPAQITVQ